MYTKRNRKNITMRKNKRKMYRTKTGKKSGKGKKINTELLKNARKLFGSI